jgi:MYXO-CTERM domain-containing protein
MHMNHVNRISVFVFVSAVITSLTLIAAPAHAVSVNFDQVSWGNANIGFEDQNSQYGEATVAFSATDAGSMTADGFGGFYGYVNIVTSVGGGSNNNWAVENLPVSFANIGNLAGGDLPTQVNFDLGQADGTAVSSLNYSLTLTSAPLALEPGGPLAPASVANHDRVEGTVVEAGDGPSDVGDESAQQAEDFVGAPTGTTVSRVQGGAISTASTNIPGIAESQNGCGPGAKARSIAYLSRMFPTSISVTQTPQQIYGTLTNYMRSSTGANSSGTANSNFVSGANAYFATNGLGIMPTVYTNTALYSGFYSNNGAAAFPMAINSLGRTGDVEVYLSWGVRQQGTNSFNQGAHAAFVSSITPNLNGTNIVSYTLKYIDDPNQNGTTTSSVEHTMTILPSGVDANAATNVTFRGVVGFWIENVATVPEPSTIELAALGLGALGLALARRSRRRRRS